jgi:hypothetical protein
MTPAASAKTKLLFSRRTFSYDPTHAVFSWLLFQYNLPGIERVRYFPGANKKYQLYHTPLTDLMLVGMGNPISSIMASIYDNYLSRLLVNVRLRCGSSGTTAKLSLTCREPL